MKNEDKKAENAPISSEGFVRIADFIKVAGKRLQRHQSLRAIAIKRYQDQRDRFLKI